MVEIAEMGRRERKRTLLYQAVRRAAVQLGLNRGVENVTIDDICTEVDIAPRTFANYFPIKDDAFLGAEEESIGGLTEAVLARPEGETAIDTLRVVLVERALGQTGSLPDGIDVADQQRLLRDNPCLMPRQLARYAAVERVIAESLARRRPNDPTALERAEALAALGSAVMRVAVRRCANEPGEVLADVLDHVFQTLCRDVADRS